MSKVDNCAVCGKDITNDVQVMPFNGPVTCVPCADAVCPVCGEINGHDYEEHDYQETQEELNKEHAMSDDFFSNAPLHKIVSGIMGYDQHEEAAFFDLLGIEY